MQVAPWRNRVEMMPQERGFKVTAVPEHTVLFFLYWHFNPQLSIINYLYFLYPVSVIAPESVHLFVVRWPDLK